MKYIDEFRNKDLVRDIAAKIKKIIPDRQIKIMEVCGTHTQNFFRFGLQKLLPANLKLISGPGCPVCVSHQSYIDSAILLSGDKDHLIVTFGDMLRIPGSRSSLEKEKTKFGNVQVVYSPLDAVKIARVNARNKIIFLGIGFETTAPTLALSLLLAKKYKLNNIFFLCSLKIIPPAMECLVKDKRLALDGFLCPGHVSAIIGTRPYEFIPQRYGIGCCIAGFEPLDIMEGLYFLIRQLVEKKPRVENQYRRVVKSKGNILAQRTIARVFDTCDAAWRGLGTIRQSGLGIRKPFAKFDAQGLLPVMRRAPLPKPQEKCRCADILRGLISPPDCPLFNRLCTPTHPVGPCMVSSEGTCNAHYKYQ